MTLRFAQGRHLRSAQGKPLGEALREGHHALAAAGIDEAGLEAELLLRHALGIDRARLFAHLDDEVSPAQEATYNSFLSFLARRLAHEPSSYITGHREFYGLDLEVTPAALIPRPETELLVDEAVRTLNSMLEPRSWKLEGATPRVVDVGVGCGAVAVTLAVHLTEATIVATDISREALLLAARNALRQGVAARITLLETDLLAGLRGPFDLIVANLPYVPTAVWEALTPEVRDHEPHEALDGGPDGLSVIRRLLCTAPGCLAPDGVLLLEIGSDQGHAALDLARRAFSRRRGRLLPDAAGLDRLLVIE